MTEVGLLREATTASRDELASASDFLESITNAPSGGVDDDGRGGVCKSLGPFLLKRERKKEKKKKKSRKRPELGGGAKLADDFHRKELREK
jgi:hypothetical protein